MSLHERVSSDPELGPLDSELRQNATDIMRLEAAIRDGEIDEKTGRRELEILREANETIRQSDGYRKLQGVYGEAGDEALGRIGSLP